MKRILYLLTLLLAAHPLLAQRLESPHGELKLACNQCHSAAGWSELLPTLNFDHGGTAFPLLGRHGQVSCISCHSSLKFAEAPRLCSDCHTDIHRGQFAASCDQCHSPEGWELTTLMTRRHQSTRFPLTGVHARLDCQACHANGNYVYTPTTCGGCHQATYAAVTTPDHKAAGFSTNCEQCHNIAVAGWKSADFVHTASFPLSGGHAVNDCNACHAAGYSNLTGACFGCHAQDFTGTTNPDHEAGGFPHDCAQCHTNQGWLPATFNHANTDFPLTGAHVSINCLECHVGGQYTNTPTDCFACHEQQYRDTDNPDHEAAQFPTTCATCHTTNGWSPATFDHNLSDFPLTGAHVSVNCLECHVGGQYTNISSDCFACHEQQYRDTDNPDHEAGLFPTSCVTCHTTNGWSPATFDHNLSDFPLTGAHVSVNCLECHVGGQYTNTSTDCFACHEQQYRDTDNPDHEAGLFPTSCVTCHTTEGWAPAAFDHNQSEFPLTGAHVTVACQLCHVGGQYTNTPSDCFACHEQRYRDTTNPDHEASNFPTTCAVCHSTAAWSPAAYDHSQSDFPLTGAHVSVNCLECHVGGQYTGTPTDCFACHEQDYRDTDNPDHETSQFPTTCATCHSTNDWSPATFDHSQSDFPLTGAHVSVSCLECHVGGQYTGTPTDCFACHEQDYRDTDNPDHETSQFPTTCATCHSTNGWTPATFDHSQSDFPLTGAHVGVNCLECHIDGQYTGTPTACFACHEDDYQEAEDHASGGYPHDCTLCHSTAGWDPPNFNHNQTDFPLTGAHIQTACSECHLNGQFEGTPTDCYFCHDDDFDNASDPDHQAAGFPTTCTICHTTNDWDDANFNHDGPYFPIYSGRHEGEWNTCADCHTNPGNYSVFCCTNCHEHNQNDEDDNHDEVGNYTWTCTSCLPCHPDGNELRTAPRRHTPVKD